MIFKAARYCAASRSFSAKLLATQVFVIAVVLIGYSLESRADGVEVRITGIAPANYNGTARDDLRNACQAWELSAQQVERFFQLSEPYPSNPYSGFYQLPCSVSGELQAEGKMWTYEINGGATATWRAEGETRYWGCSVEECERLVLMPADSMNPDGVAPL